MPDVKIPMEPGHFYHIWSHANGRENFFREEENYRFFLKRYSYYIQPIAETFAYCLMPNHLHLMVRIRVEEELLDFIRERRLKRSPNLQNLENLGAFSRLISQQFSNLFNSYTKSYNKFYDRRGSLFMQNFHRKRIDTDSYFATLIAYIHHNPVHHVFVRCPEEWVHSSWHAYLQNKESKICREEAIDWFGSRKEFFRIHRDI